MTTGNVLYLLMCLAMFGVFAGVLAYQSWKQALLGPDVVTTPGPAAHPDPHDPIAA